LFTRVMITIKSNLRFIAYNTKDKNIKVLAVFYSFYNIVNRVE